MAKKRADTRRYARFDILEYALLHHAESHEPVRSVVVDVGIGGMQLLSKKKIPVGDLCQVTLGKPDGTKMRLPGEVRFSNPLADSQLFATGLRFQPETHEQRAEVVEYVHGIFQKQADQLAG